MKINFSTGHVPFQTKKANTCAISLALVQLCCLSHRLAWVYAVKSGSNKIPKNQWFFFRCSFSMKTLKDNVRRNWKEIDQCGITLKMLTVNPCYSEVRNAEKCFMIALMAPTAAPDATATATACTTPLWVVWRDCGRWWNWNYCGRTGRIVHCRSAAARPAMEAPVSSPTFSLSLCPPKLPQEITLCLTSSALSAISSSDAQEL